MEEVNILAYTLLISIDGCHAVDVMHLTKKICVNLLGSLGTYGKDKDTLESREDLKAMKQ